MNDEIPAIDFITSAQRVLEHCDHALICFTIQWMNQARKRRMGLIVIDAKVFGRFTPGAKQLNALCSTPYQHLRNVSGDDILAREQMIQIHIHRVKAPFFDFLIGFINAVTFLWLSDDKLTWSQTPDCFPC